MQWLIGQKRGHSLWLHRLGWSWMLHNLVATLGCCWMLMVPKLRLTAREVLMRNLRVWLHRRVALQSQNQSNLPRTARILQKKGASSTTKL